MWKRSKYKAQGDTQEPVGKSMKGMCMASAWMCQTP